VFVIARPDIKKFLIIAHDIAMTAIAVLVAIALRFEDNAFQQRLDVLLPILPGFVVIAGGIYWYLHLYQSKWRFASMPDLITIAKAVGLICLVLVIAEYIAINIAENGQYFLGRRLILIYWLVQCFLLGAPRLLYRYWKDFYRAADASSNPSYALLLGRGEEVEIVIRALEANRTSRIVPLGILSPRRGDLGQSIRNVPVEGTLDALEEVVRAHRTAGIFISRLIASPSALESDAEKLSARSTKLGLALARLQRVGEAAPDITPIEIEDLLSRSPIAIDPQLLDQSIKGRRILVTGGAGSIGTEICMRCVSLGAKALCVIDNSEPALHQVVELLRLESLGCEIVDHICDIRDRQRLDDVMTAFRPEVVFHAAALKHVPYLERDWQEGIKTNAFGSVNVAESAVAAGAEIVVMISTDKAVNPVSILGITKRLAECAMEVYDAEALALGKSTRFISVRFGNVLGSAGSVIPKFKAQIARGGPVTVTHPDMVRYFMTVREAASLVIAAGGHARLRGHAARVSVYVLRMGHPVRILELAERMVRLSGFEPYKDIPIKISGVRPGERLNEILFSGTENSREIGVEGVMAAHTTAPERAALDACLARLASTLGNGNRAEAEAAMKALIPEFIPEDAAASQ
jgi:FlaA1/EpsC-like NDP-sugar epimerase